MLISCPNCGGETDVPERLSCRHCRADLKSLVEIIDCAGDALLLGKEYLRFRNFPEANSYARESYSLLHSAEAISLGLIAALLSRDADQVREWLEVKTRFDEP